MPLGYTAYFGTSALVPYTGPTGSIGKQPRGKDGTGGATGGTGNTGPRGITGPTGTTIIGTYLQTNPKKPAYNYYVIQFSDDHGNVVTAAPRGLTGKYGVVVGTTANIGNTGGGQTGFVRGFTWGTYNPVTGICGGTLSFARICASGDFVLYSDSSLGIGTGDSDTMIGISGPAAAYYGTVIGQSVGEIAYLSDRKNAKDAYGLTASSGATALSGLTWGTITSKFVNHSERFHIHGSPLNGVQKDPFYISTTTGNVHLLYPPFRLDGITMDFHTSKHPITYKPQWSGDDSTNTGNTAEYGESINVTLIVDGGPRGIAFGDGFFFTEEPSFTHGRDILNCLSYDNGKNWFVTMAGAGYGVSGPKESEAAVGSCCNTELQDCQDFVRKSECPSNYSWLENVSCASRPHCVATEDIDTVWGSCCVNKNTETESTESLCVGGLGPLDDPNYMTQEKCERFGGLFRRFVPCDPELYPCGDPCDENFGKLGACCEYDANGQSVGCSRLTAFECGLLLEAPAFTVYNGDNTFCTNSSCCQHELQVGACCLGENSCLDQVKPIECVNTFNGTYMGHNTSCETVSCTCPPENEIGPGYCIACYRALGGIEECHCCNHVPVDGCIRYEVYGYDYADTVLGYSCSDIDQTNWGQDTEGIFDTSLPQHPVIQEEYQDPIVIMGTCCYTFFTEDEDTGEQTVHLNCEGNVPKGDDGNDAGSCYALWAGGNNGEFDPQAKIDWWWNEETCSCVDPCYGTAGDVGLPGSDCSCRPYDLDTGCFTPETGNCEPLE